VFGMGREKPARAHVLAAAIAVALCGAAHAGDPEARPKRILAVHTLEPGVPSNQEFTAGLRGALPLGADLALYAEHLDRLRFPDQAYAAGFHAWLRDKYAGAPPDVIVAIGGDAIDFFSDPRQTPFSGIPVVFGFVGDDTVRAKRLPATFTGVAEHFAIRENLALARSLFPETRHVVLVGGASPQDRPFNELLRREVLASRGELEVVELFGLPMTVLQERLRTLPPRSVVLVLTFLQDGAGRQWMGPQSVPAMVSASTAPIFCPLAHVLGMGVTGGVLTDLGESGRLVARTVLRVLAGERPDALPVRQSGTNRVVLDGRQLVRFGVPDRLIPPGAEVRYREPSPWDRYRWYVALFALGFLLQSALIAGLLFQRRARWRAEAKARENLGVIAHMNRVAAIGELAGSFAHELNSPLGAVLNNAQAARRFIAAGPGHEAEVQSCLDDIVGDTRRAGDVIRRIRGLLRRESWNPVELDVAGVIRDAVRLVHAEARDLGVTVDVQVRPLPRVNGDDVQLVQVLLNLLMNAIDAVAGMPEGRRRVAIEAAPSDDCIVIRVVDAGPGVSPPDAERVFEPFFTTKPVGLGMGLAISRSIVEAHGGSIAVSQTPGGGAAFEVVLPAAEAPDAEKAQAAG
jgi:signal transduction histidine kinase